MITRVLLLSLLAGAVFASNALAAESKTDLTRDVVVENSTTNFVLVAGAPQPAGKSKVSFDLAAPAAGRYTLICFVDGKPAKPVEFTAPGPFVLSTRGLAPGAYRVTLQLIDRQGGVGRVTTILQVK
jgi:hypothetical protein